MTEQYATQKQLGEEYQDFVTYTLYHLGQPLVQNTSRKYQILIGENMIGWEIKYVGTMKRHNAIYVEYAEKSKPENPEYVPSGILRKDNTIFMVMGDYDTFYVLQKTRLKRCYEDKHYLRIGGWDLKPTPTSKGFALPLSVAEQLKVFKVVIQDGEAKLIT